MVDGEEMCCNGNGVCTEQEEGPRRCECDEGARGDTCATPPPGTHPVTTRDCEGEDPACVQRFDFVEVEAFDDCPDLDGEPIASIIVRAAADDSGAWPPGLDPAPAAILAHGASQAHSDYYDLVEHLAANGIVAASIDATFAGSVTTRANRLLSYLVCLRDTWPDRDRLAPEFAFVGHSRGGAAAAVAANAIAEGALPGDIEVAAEVLLAPSESGLLAIQRTDTPALLVLQGSRDPDTTGAGLSWYDLAGDENADATELPTKSLVWAFGATHHRFHQGLVPANGELEATIDGPAHWTLSRAYIGAFLFWQLLGRDDMRGYVTDASVPASVRAIWEPAQPGVFLQHSQGLGTDLPGASRRVIHDFESGELSPSAVGGDVSTSDLDRAVVGARQEANPPYSGRQRTTALEVTWSEDASDPRIVFELPVEATDLSGFAMVSVRAGQPFARAADECEAENPCADQDVAITLRDTTGAHTVLASDMDQPVPVPDFFAPETMGNWLDGECQAVDFLRTIRVPLADYCDAGLDLASITAIELSFPRPAGTLVLDSLELTLDPTEEPAAAACGN